VPEAGPTPSGQPPQPAAPARPQPAAASAAPARPSAGPVTQKRDDKGRVLTSPLVRNIAKAQGVDLAQVPGTGFQNRVTKEDIEGFIQSTAAAAEPAAPSRPGAAAPAQQRPAP